MHDIRQLSEQRIGQRHEPMLVDTRHDCLRFVVTQRAVGDDAELRLTGNVEIRARKMEALEQRMATAALLMRRTGQCLQALVEGIVPRCDGFHRQRRR
jgi:hypothetical protein